MRDGLVALIEVGQTKRFAQFSNETMRATTRPDYITIESLLNALSETQARSFSVSLPTLSKPELFATRDARKALKSIDLSRCAIDLT